MLSLKAMAAKVCDMKILKAQQIIVREWIICKPEASQKLQNHQPLARSFE